MTALNKPVRRVSASTVAKYGPDCGKRIVVTLVPGNGAGTPDIIELRPERTRRAETVALIDVYHYAMKCRVNAAQLAKARDKKAKKDQQKKDRAWAREIKKPL